MRKSLVTAMGVLAIVSGSMLISSRADAGASASAPSKYVNADHARVNRQSAQRTDFKITEFSSSSARTSSHKH